MEIFREKNVATRIVFPIVDADGDTVTGATALDSESTTWADGSNPGAYGDLTNEATEIGTTGIYYLILTAAEMNFNYIAIQVKTTTVGAKTQHILINTRFASLTSPVQTGDSFARLGAPAGASVSADVAAVKGDTAAILVDTGTTLEGRIPAALVGGRMNSDIGAKTGNVALSAQEKLDVNAEVDTALTDKLSTADAEPTGVPAANATPLQKLAYLFMSWRNELTVTATKKTYYGDDGLAEFEKDLADDGTTYSETEINGI